MSDRADEVDRIAGHFVDLLWFQRDKMDKNFRKFIIALIFFDSDDDLLYDAYTLRERIKNIILELDKRIENKHINKKKDETNFN